MKSKDNNNENNQAEGQEKKLKYPRSIFFIIGNEFCERFSYYGAKAILVLFFRNVLLYSENMATEYYHVFAMACYFTPVLGAIIADSLLGKFRTIFYISILYAIGNIVLSYASYLQNEAVTWVGLAAIALGTGGIKPCVSAFGGDQFGPGQEKQLQKFFSLFYISINAGSLLSTFITPILREDVQCFGRLDCFPLAFGVPAALMVVALLLFVLGKLVTNYVMVPPKKGNIVVQVVSCVFTSLSRKMFSKGPKREHWLDYADDKYDAQTISDIKGVMRILFLYLPLPIFWALFDQQGSRWTLQATKMDGNLFGAYRLKPDQIQVVNPLLIIIFIPIFEYIIYPLLAKVNLLKKPLQRMVTGGILAAVAFIICGFFQLKIESELPTELNDNSVHFSIFNGMPAKFEILDSSLSQLKLQNIEAYDHLIQENVNINALKDFKLTIKLDTKVGSCEANKNYNISAEITQKSSVLFITQSICDPISPTVQTFNYSNILEKPAEGGAYIGILFVIDNYNMSSDTNFMFRNEKFDKVEKPIVTPTDSQTSVGYTEYQELDVHLGGQYRLTLTNETGGKTNEIEIKKELSLDQGGSYILIVNSLDTSGKFDVTQIKLVEPNSVPMLWQIVQYSVITAGEIMFSITGLEFSYEQAPQSMKAVLQAAWLLTVAFGNVIVIIIAAAKIAKQSSEFFFFGGLMVADMIVFAIMAYFYVPYHPTKNNEELNEEKKTQPNENPNKEEVNGVANGKNGVSNDGFNEEDTKF